MKWLEMELNIKDVQLYLTWNMFTFIQFLIPIQNIPKCPLVESMVVTGDAILK